MTTTTARANGEYNVTIWRLDSATREVISVCVGLFENGKILRASGTWTGDNGLPAFHDAYVRENTQFCGKQCVLVLTHGTEGMKSAMRASFKDAFKRHRMGLVGVFGEYLGGEVRTLKAVQ